MEQLDTYVNILVGGVVVPVIELLKQKYPALNPATKVVLSLVAVTAITYGLNQWVLGNVLTFPQLLDYSFKSQVVAQLVHALYNTNPKPTEEKNG